jgi:hypothetical protein
MLFQSHFVLAAAALSGDYSVPWWVPILTLIVGSLVTLGVEYIRTVNARADRQEAAIERKEDREAERAAREQERRGNLADEHRAQQRDALVELQEKVSAYIRLNGDAQHADSMAWKAAGEPADRFPVSLLPEGLSDEINAVQRRMQVLAQRIDDAGVRDLVGQLVQTANTLIVPSDRKPPSAAAQIRMSDAFQALNDQIGRILRSLPTD